MRWLNARYCGSCWSCREPVIRGDRVLFAVHVHCRNCGRKLEAAAVVREQTRRDAAQHARQSPERAS